MRVGLPTLKTGQSFNAAQDGFANDCDSADAIFLPCRHLIDF
jgi:hypothetical protein